MAEITRILQKLHSISSEKALDVATGDEIFIRSLMKTLKGYNTFIGVDLSQKRLKTASRRSKRNVTQFLKMKERIAVWIITCSQQLTENHLVALLYFWFLFVAFNEKSSGILFFS
jgi:hypothetical protein